MADYRIEIGAELRTKDIDTEIKKYKGDVNVGAILNTEGITRVLNAYRAKPLDVNTKLSTKGITEAIRKYKAKKDIKVGIVPDWRGIESEILRKTFNSTLNVKVSLNWAGVAGQISQQSEKLAPISLNAELNDGAISNAVKEFNAAISKAESSAAKISIGVDPDFTGVEEKIGGYTVSKPINVKPQILRKDIIEELKKFQNEDTENYVFIKARLIDGAVRDAINEYKTKHPDKIKFPIDLTLGYTTEFDRKTTEKINEYKNAPVEVPVKLKPAAKGYDTQITRKAIQIEAVLAPDAINKAIENPTSLSKIPIDVRLVPKDLNRQVKQLKPFITDPLDIDVGINEASANSAITAFHPASLLDVGVKLDEASVNNAIATFKPTAMLNVNIKANDGDVDEKTGKQNAQEPVRVNVELDRDNLNEQIKNFKPTSKVNVGVDLDFRSHKGGQKGVPQQIKDYQTKSKINVGVELDKDSINSDIQAFKPDAPIKLGVELDKDSVFKQVEDIKQQLQALGDITIHFGSDVVDAAKAVARTGNNNSEAAKAASRVIQQTEKIVSDDAEKSIKKVTSKGIGKYFRISKASSEDFNKEMEKLVNKWTKGKGSLADVKIKTRTFWDEEANKNVERLYQAQVEYNNELGVTQKKTIAWRKIGTKTVKGQLEDVYGFAEVSSQYSKSIDKTKNKTDNFVKQQKKAVSDLTNQANQLNRDAIDQNAARPIKDKTHLDALSNKYTEITDAITRMGNASSDAFDDERNNVNRLISEYKSMRSEFKNAENVANKLSGTDYQSGKKIAEQNLAEFKAKAKDYAQMSKTIGDLDEAFNKVGDASSLKEFTNQLRVAKAELAKVKVEANSANLGKNLRMDVSSLKDGILSFQNANPKIAEFKTKIDGAEVSVESLLNDLSEVKTKGDLSVVNHKFGEFAKAAKNAGVALNDTVVKVKTVKDIKNKLKDLGFEGFAQEVSRAHADVEKLGISSQELQSALTRVDNALDSIQTADEANDIKALTAANEEYEESLRRLYSLITLQENAQKVEFDAEILDLDKANALLKLESLFEQGSQAAKKYGTEVQRLRDEINGCADSGDLQKINRQISILEKQVKSSNLQTKTLGTRFKEQFSRYTNYISIASVFMYATQAARNMFEQVKLIDSAMTELKKVTNETDASYNQFLSNAASRAKELGTTIDGLVSSTADFARLGYGFEDSQKLAEVANIYAVVGDEIEGVEDATQSLVSTLAAFKGEMNGMSDSDFAMSIVDKMNEVSNNFAISSGGIGEALQRSASSMAAANNSLDETIAMITAANEVAQNPEKVGKWLCRLKKWLYRLNS